MTSPYGTAYCKNKLQPSFQNAEAERQRKKREQSAKHCIEKMATEKSERGLLANAFIRFFV